MSLKRKNEDIISNTNKSIKSNFTETIPSASRVVSKLNYITFNPTTPPPFKPALAESTWTR